MKKTLILILTILACAVASSADTSWYKYPVYFDRIDQVVETADKVYYRSGTSLFSFSPSDNESYVYNSLNNLSDEKVGCIYYNPAKEYLLVAYTNGNIDLLYPDGSIVNLPDIRDSGLTVDRTINDVAFGEDRIAVATNFGLVVFDDVRGEVVESGIYNNPLNAVAIMNGHLLIYGHKATNFSLMASPLGMRHNTIDKFRKIGGYAMTSMMPVDDNTLYIVENNTGKLLRRKVDFTVSDWWNDPLPEEIIVKEPLHMHKGGCWALTDNKICFLGADNIESRSIPQQLRGLPTALNGDIDKIWTGTAEGISRHDISTGTPTVLYDKQLCRGYITDGRVGYMRWSADGERLYISNLETSRYRTYRMKEGSTNYQTTNVIEGGEPRDVSLMRASADHSYAKKYQSAYNNTRMYGDPCWIIEDPDNHDRYYCCSYFEGLYVIERNAQTGEYEELCKFTEENAPITSNWGQRVLDVNIDHYGNLWMGTQHGAVYHVLPAAKRKGDPRTVKIGDWKSYKKLESLEYASKDMMTLICRKSNMVFLCSGAYEKGFVAIDTKGTYDNPTDDNVMMWNRVVDQDGNTVQYMYVTFLLEDNRGCVWIGTNAGVFEITNPSQATNPTMTVRRIKVPRNDGTNYADYLLDSDMINWMALDPAGRKWIATDASGLYLVSETGDEIIRSYTVDNSPLLSNQICTVECDPNDNTVYVGTTDGLYSFKSDASAGREDYSEIYAYPNPVRPEYSGLVTITGLVDNSVVKITDAAGNVMYETRSEGGMATWDACNRNGERVRSGVYYVYAGANNSGTASGAVTKILVIN